MVLLGRCRQLPRDPRSFPTNSSRPLDKSIGTCCLHCSHVSDLLQDLSRRSNGSIAHCCESAHRFANAHCARLRAASARLRRQSNFVRVKFGDGLAAANQMRGRRRRRALRRRADARCSSSSSPSRTRPAVADGEQVALGERELAVERQEIAALADRPDDVEVPCSVTFARAHRIDRRATRRTAPDAADRSSRRRRRRNCATRPA